MCFCFDAPLPPLLYSSGANWMNSIKQKHNNRKLSTINRFSARLLLLFLPFPHEPVLTRWRDIHRACTSVQSFITETPWLIFRDLEIIAPPWASIVFTIRLVNTERRENPAGRPARCPPPSFTFTHTFVCGTSECKQNARPSLATGKQSAHSRWLVGCENNEGDPAFRMTFCPLLSVCTPLFWPVTFLIQETAFHLSLICIFIIF